MSCIMEHIKVYEVEELMDDLLDFAAATLTLNGRLVFLLPTPRKYVESIR